MAREFQEFPQGAYYLAVHAAIFAQYLGVFAFTNLFCAMQMIQNFTSCFFWYALDIFGKILYLLPQVLILFLTLIGVPAKELETNPNITLQCFHMACMENILNETVVFMHMETTAIACDYARSILPSML
jgi:hypothetical protein